MRLFSSIVGLIVLSMALQAKDKKAPKQPQDEIAVIGHIPATSSSVRRFLATQHYSSYYLYAEHDGGKGVTLIDVTKPAAPSVLGDVAYPSNGSAGTLVAVAGTAAVVTDGNVDTSSVPPPQNIRIMDFSDPLRPKIAREFPGVTAISRDDRRGLIFVANADGIWILHQHLAEDPEVEKAYAHHVLYDH